MQIILQHGLFCLQEGRTHGNLALTEASFPAALFSRHVILLLPLPAHVVLLMGGEKFLKQMLLI